MKENRRRDERRPKIRPPNRLTDFCRESSISIALEQAQRAQARDELGLNGSWWRREDERSPSASERYLDAYIWCRKNKIAVVGMQINKPGAKDYSRLYNSDDSDDGSWKSRVSAVTEFDLADLAAYRGYGLDGSRQIAAAGLIGKHHGAWAFPVYDGSGTFRGVHELVSRQQKAWIYDPKGIGAWPMIHGSLTNASLAVFLESSWDWLTFLIVTGAIIHPAHPIICTRGAETFAKIKQICPRGIDAIAIPQNDTPGQKWLQNVASLGVKDLRIVQVPETIHDFE